MDFKEKLALSAQLNSLIKDLNNEGIPLKERIAKGKERISILKKLKAANIPATPTKELTIEEKFNNGDFSQLEASEFRKYLVLLKDKLSLDELKSGTVKWLEANQSDLVDVDEVLQ